MRIQTALAFPPGRGGKRKGAGRKPNGAKAGVKHEKRATVTRTTPVFVTTKLVAGLPTLRAENEEEVIRQAFREVNALRALRIIQYSIQSNHLHLIVETRNAEQLSRGMSQLTIRLARRLNKLWGRKGKLWKDRFHSRVVETPTLMANVLNYCLLNGRKHGAWKGAVPCPVRSACWRTGQMNLACGSNRMWEYASTRIEPGTVRWLPLRSTPSPEPTAPSPEMSLPSPRGVGSCP